MDQVQGAGLLGFGMNVVSMTPRSAVTAAVVTPVSGDAGTYTYSGVEYVVPENVAVVPGFGDETTSGSVIVGNTRSEFQSKLSAQLGVTGSYNAFSGSFNFAFANESKSESQYSFAVVQGNYEAYTLLLQQDAGSALDAAFVSDPDVLAIQAATAFDPSDPGPFYRVFEKWGTHYVNQVAMGANLQYYAAVASTYSSSEQTIGSNLQLEYNAVFVSAGATASADWNQLGQGWTNDRSVSIVATGGSTELFSALAPTFDDNFNSQFEQWRQSIAGNLGVQRYGVRDMSTLFSGQAAQAVSDALALYLSYGLEGRAAFDWTGDGPTGESTLITINGVQQQATAASAAQSYGGIQFVAADPSSLAVLANTTAYAVSWSDYGSAWAAVQAAADALTVSDYYVILTVFAATNGLCFPPATSAMWLQTCGASLEAMQTASQYYCGEDYRIAYALVGQQNMPSGQAVETFVMNTEANQQPVEGGYFYADACAPLAPNAAGGFTVLGAGA